MSGSGKPTDRLEIDKPVTPAMQRGWAPKTEKTKDAMNEESRTSDTPYCPVITVKCKENAIPGRTLGTIRFQGEEKSLQYLLGKENKGSRGEYSIIPRIRPIAPVPWRTGTYVAQDSRADVGRAARL